jgi:hypothetical protein
VLMCPACLAARARGRGPYPDLTDEELRTGLNLLPTWALAQKVAAFSVPACERTDLLALTTRHLVRWGGRSLGRR